MPVAASVLVMPGGDDSSVDMNKNFQSVAIASSSAVDCRAPLNCTRSMVPISRVRRVASGVTGGVAPSDGFTKRSTWSLFVPTTN